MIRELLTIAKVKIFFLTVNKYREFKARRRLAAYVKTLSPEKQAAANALRAKLDAAKPGSAAGILRAEISRVNIAQCRLIERIEAVTPVTR